MFKTILGEDLEVFLNLDEFGMESTINGIPIITIEDNDAFTDMKNNNADLLYEDVVIIYCRVIDFDRINTDNCIEYNGMFYNLVSKDEKEGIYKIILQRSTQGALKEWLY